MALKINGKQIRCHIPGVVYSRISKEARKYNLTLSQYAGLLLSGLRITAVDEEFDDNLEETDITTN